MTVESGTLSWTLLSGTVPVTRPGVALAQVTEPGAEILVDSGAGVLDNDDVVHVPRAAAAVPASVLIAGIFETGEPIITRTEESGMPAP